MRRLVIKALHLFRFGAFVKDVYHRCRYLVNFDLQSRNARVRNRGAPDDLPIPPPHLVYLVVGRYSIEEFYPEGLMASECIKTILEKNGLNIDAFESTLDFGCGCGRVIRHWKTLSGPKLYGTDYNPVLVNWCKKNLTFAEFKINKLSYKLDYEDNTFDFIYALSVFTHLSEKLQNFWISELKRILKPGGFLLITVHGTTRLHQLTLEERERFNLGQLLVKLGKFAGTNTCCAYHPEKYVRQSLAKGFSIVDFIPGGARDANQDQFLLRKITKDN